MATSTSNFLSFFDSVDVDSEFSEKKISLIYNSVIEFFIEVLKGYHLLIKAGLVMLHISMPCTGLPVRHFMHIPKERAFSLQLRCC